MNDKKNDVTILIVDDDEVDVRAVRRALRKQGVHNPVKVASNGLEALAMLRGERDEPPNWPYIVLLDVNMPMMNGIEFLTTVREDPVLTDTVIFMLTTSDDDRDITAAYRQHVSGYVTKSEAGVGFADLVSLLSQFTLTVRFPVRDLQQVV